AAGQAEVLGAELDGDLLVGEHLRPGEGVLDHVVAALGVDGDLVDAREGEVAPARGEAVAAAVAGVVDDDRVGVLVAGDAQLAAGDGDDARQGQPALEGLQRGPGPAGQARRSAHAWFFLSGAGASRRSARNRSSSPTPPPTRGAGGCDRTFRRFATLRRS